eukprot:CAMPEP_0194079952 /NCGR_PEP_ID=MMETSP0149-20130528/6076_1 /TAXON_ID=122233 /ORGANISM="Chaetoceros debilis, Strain MM31A-1" /LENGTH=154 /DNA_ID=CAMNT_0038761569 /DNA_START=113 /DNA_END=577 /DNA_ORIENTATION=+
MNMKTIALLLVPLTASAFAPSTSVRPSFTSSTSASTSTFTCSALNAENLSRRIAMRGLVATAFVTLATGDASSSAANALDMDAFMNAELDKDTKNCDPKLDRKCAPKMNDTEALCKYGQGGKARAAACMKLRESGAEVPTAPPAGKSLGGAYAM